MTTIAPDTLEPATVLATGVKARVLMLDLLSIVPYYTSELSSALARRGDVDLQLGAITYYLDRACYERQGLSFAPGLLDVVSRIPRLPRVIRRASKTAEYLVNLASLRVRRQADVIHVQFLPLVLFGSGLELRFLRSAQRRGVKVVYTVHNVLPHDASSRLRARYAEVYEMADRLICHDQAACSRLIEDFGVKPRKISVIAHGPLLTPQTFKPTATKRSSQCLILWQGILRPYKGVDFLLDAWQQVRSRGKSACLAIVGGGDEAIERQVREKVAVLNLNDSVPLDLRFVSVEELQSYHQAADVIVYPYREVTTSGALMTGINYGKAILASRLPAFEQTLCHDRNALLADYGNAAEWALQLERLIGDASLRCRLGESLRASSSATPGWDEIASQTVACYEAVLA